MPQDPHELAVVTSGVTSNSLGVVRGLGERKVPVALLDLYPNSPVRHSKYVKKLIPCHDFQSSPHSMVEALLKFAKECDHTPVLLLTGDREAHIVAQFRTSLDKHFQILLSDAESIRYSIQKNLFHERLNELGIAHPRTQILPDFSQLEEAARTTPMPFILKPSDSLAFSETFHRKLFLIESQEHLDSSLGILKQSALEVFIQEAIPASEYYEVYCLLDEESAPLAFTGWQRLRQFPPWFGTASLSRSKIQPAAVKLALDILSRFNMKGLVSVEMIRDARDGQYKILEINPRTTLQNRLAARCAVDLEYMTYCYLTGKEFVSNPATREGIYWVDNLKDPVSILLTIFGRLPFQAGFFEHLFRRKVQSTFSPRDPAPYVMSYFYLARKFLPWLRSGKRIQQHRPGEEQTYGIKRE